MAEPSVLDNYVEMLSIGPFGGLDMSTPPYYVAPPNFVDGENFVPNHGYGGFVTVAGRVQALINALPGPCNGIHCFHRQGLPDVYLFAVDILIPALAPKNYGTLYYATLNGLPQLLTLPNGHLTAGQQTFFADCQQWCFITNGVDTPLKIDLNLNVTNWGIAAPTTGPSLSLIGPGALVGTYYYTTTFGTPTQESGQGKIVGPITCTTTTASNNEFIINGNPQKGDVITVNVGALNQLQYAVNYTVPDNSTTIYQVAQALITAINADPYITQYAFAGSPTNPNAPNGQVVMTAAQPGTQGNEVYYFLQVTIASGGMSANPQDVTTLSGGQDGNTVNLRNLDTITTTDPQVTELNIYRLGGSLGTWNLIHTQPYPVTNKLFDDTIADTAVNGQQLTIFRDPPPAFKYITTHMERVFGFGVNPCGNTNSTITADPSLVWWSNLNEPWGFNSDVNTFTCGDNHFSDVATGLAENGGILMALKTRTCYWIYGSTDDNFQPIFAWYVGNQAPRSVATGYGLTFWYGKQGVHFTDGYSKTQISDGAFQQTNIKKFLDSLTLADRQAAVGFIYDRQYYLSFPTVGKTVLYDLRTQSWYKLNMSTSQAYFDLEDDAPVIAMDDKVVGQVDQWFAGPCDFGGSVTAWVQSRTSDTGGMHATKTLRYAALLAPVQHGAKAQLVVTVDPGCDTQASVPMNIDLGTGTDRHEWPLQLEGFKFNLWMCVQGPAVIDKIAVYGDIKRVHEPDLTTKMSAGLEL